MRVACAGGTCTAHALAVEYKIRRTASAQTASAYAISAQTHKERELVHYFDHSASAPPYDEAVKAIAEVMSVYYGNPSSLHRVGAEAERLLKQARFVIASTLGAKPEQIVCTSGGTESNNLAIRGAAAAFAGRGRHYITTQIEHDSVYECFRKLERDGADVTYVGPDASGAVRVDDVLAALRDDTALVSVMHVNNETGAVQPIEQLGRALARYPRVLFHVDAVQSWGKLPLAPAEWGVDMLALSAHKCGGPRGAGVLYRRSGLKLEPIMHGGGQEYGLRPGTENVPLIVGMAKACRMNADTLGSDAARLRDRRAELIERLAHMRGVRLTVPRPTHCAPHIVHFTVPGVRAEVLLHALEQQGFYASSRSACSSGKHEPSRVLTAMGYSEAEASSGIRISLSQAHRAEQVAALADAIDASVRGLNGA